MIFLADWSRTPATRFHFRFQSTVRTGLTLQKQQSFHESVYVESGECVGHCASMKCLQNFNEIDGFLYTCQVVDDVPMVGTYDGSIKFGGRKKLRQSN